MNIDEEIAERYLRSLGYTDIVYEPDGNIPPDFLLNGVTAIEVRKLNQHHVINGITKPLEEVEYKLIPMLDKMLNDFNGGAHESSAFVCITYSRPVGKIRERIKEIKKILVSHLPQITQKAEYKISENIHIELLPASERHDSAYILGAMPDMDAGGFVVSEIYSNLKIVLEEKTRKIAMYKHKYKEWWLVLIDYIGHSLRERDVVQLKELPVITNGWDKVILVSPQENTHGFEI